MAEINFPHTLIRFLNIYHVKGKMKYSSTHMI